MNLPIIQSLWIGDDLTNLEKLCVQSFLDHGHEFHLYTYTDIGGIPAGATVKDGNEILSADKIFYNKGGSVAGFSDWFRYEILRQRGGWWLDMDMVCIRPFALPSTLKVQYCADGLYTTCPLYAPPNHPLMVYMAKHCSEHKNREGSRFGFVGGPRPLTHAILTLGLQEFGMPFTYSDSGDGWNTLCDNTHASGIDALSKDLHSVHFGNSSAVKRIFDKNARYDSESLFEQLKTKHGITTAADAPHITTADIAANMVEHRLYKFERRSAHKRKITAIAGSIIALIVIFVLFLFVRL